MRKVYISDDKFYSERKFTKISSDNIIWWRFLFWEKVYKKYLSYLRESLQKKYHQKILSDEKFAMDDLFYKISDNDFIL